MGLATYSRSFYLSYLFSLSRSGGDGMDDEEGGEGARLANIKLKADTARVEELRKQLSKEVESVKVIKYKSICAG